MLTLESSVLCMFHHWRIHKMDELLLEWAALWNTFRVPFPTPPTSSGLHLFWIRGQRPAWFAARTASSPTRFPYDPGSTNSPSCPDCVLWVLVWNELAGSAWDWPPCKMDIYIIMVCCRGVECRPGTWGGWWCLYFILTIGWHVCILVMLLFCFQHIGPSCNHLAWASTIWTRCCSIGPRYIFIIALQMEHMTTW